MSVSAPAVEKANGLSTVVDVITSPAKAFQTLRAVPMWGWAYIVVAILCMIGQFLVTPAIVHMTQATWPANVAASPKLAAATPEQQQSYLNVAVTIIRFIWIILPVFVFIGAAIQAVIMLVFNALGRGSATFKQLWCGAMNVFVVSYGLYNVVNGISALARGPQAFNVAADVYRSVPSLAWLAPGASVKLLAFLAAFNVMSIWGAVLLAMAMIHIARVSRGNAIACAVVTTVLAGLYFAASAR